VCAAFDMAKVSFLLLVLIFFPGCNSVGLTPSERNSLPKVPTPAPTPSDRIPDVSDDVLIPWKQTIGSIDYRWNGKDLFVRINKGYEIGLFSKAARKYRRSFDRSGRKCVLDSFFTPVAVAENILSYEHESGYGGPGCGVSDGEWRYATVDVFDSTSFLDLRSFFSEDEILHAFLANSQISSYIQKSIGNKKLTAVPASLKELSAYLTRFDYEIFNGYSYFEGDYLERFAFHHIEGDMISIRISATSTSTAGRAIHEYVEILLPIPERLREALEKADASDAGFLMKDADVKVGTKAAMIELTF